MPRTLRYRGVMMPGKSLSRKLLQTFTACVALGAVLLLAAPSSMAADTAKRQTFLTHDKVQLSADIYCPSGARKHPVVILLHQLGKSNRAMLPLVAPLLKDGIIVVNLDMRGHGNSASKNSQAYSFEKFTNADWAMLPGDLAVVTANVAKLPNADTSKLAIVGASIGANASLIDARSDSLVKAVVALSPGLTYHELSPVAAMSALSKPVLIISARDDVYSADSGAKLSKMNGKCSFDLIPNGGHAAAMFATHPELSNQIATWLHKAM